MLKTLSIFLLLILALIPLTFAADEYKPYLHKPSVPEHPKAKLYGKYQTNLFPGAGTYTYELEVPKGTNNLQPSLTISYNSQAMKQRPSILGAGWALPQNYVTRDINSTPSNASDDMFKIILNGASYDLVFDGSDGFYHTETETFARIENLTNNSNTYGTYWTVALKDGTKLRFGHNNDSELASNMGYGHVIKWSLDQIEDTHGNRIFYSYLEDPYLSDKGTAYPYRITYNNDEKRVIEFAYEDPDRPDYRLAYEQGNRIDERRRIKDISIFFDNSLVRRYSLRFENLNNGNSISSLSGLAYFGSDNISLLHNMTFGYYRPATEYYNSTHFNVSVVFSNSNGDDLGVRLMDTNNDGLIDIVKGRQSTSELQVWLNNGSGWAQTAAWTLPEFFTDVSDLDKGVRVADLNNDGLPDLIKGRSGERNAWLNTGSGWSQSSIWVPPVDFVSSTSDQGTRLMDFNGDGRVDIIQAKEDGSTKTAYLNTGQGWADVSSRWVAPAFFVKATTFADFGLREADINGDGLIDFLQGYNFGGSDVKNAWLNNGSGWVNAPGWVTPVIFTSSSKSDTGVRLVDLNGDGLVDLQEDFSNESVAISNAWLNTGRGWVADSSWDSPEAFTKNSKNVGRRLGDVNGDGFADILVGYVEGSENRTYTWVKNETIPYLLGNVTNEFGGITRISYAQSTSFDNTGGDAVSDIGFNILVVGRVVQDNGMEESFRVLGNTSYSYSGGMFNYTDSEFRGFNIVNETLADNSTIAHYFHQSSALKGKEFRTETYTKGDSLLSRAESNYNLTLRTTDKDGDYFIVNLISASSYLFDGQENAVTTNISYGYDNYSNVIRKVSLGDASFHGDEKYEKYEFAYNRTAWILDRVSKYQLYTSDNFTKLRESKYFYDDNELSVVSLGDLTKKEDWLNDGTGNSIMTYTYDEFGNLYQETDVMGNTKTYEYGAKDFTSTYPDRITNALGHAVDYEYDIGTGNLLSYTKHGAVFSNEYDAFGRILREVQPYDTSALPTKEYEYIFDGTAPEIIKVSQKTTSNNTIDIYYYYDGFANLVQIKTPAENGQQVVKNIFYDGLFRVNEEQNPYFNTFSTLLSNVSNTTNTTKYNYDALSRVISVINPDGTTKNTTYNKNSIKDYDENGNFKTYYLDAYDRIIAVEEHNTDFYIGDNLTYNTTYSYNGADELLGIKDNEGNYFNFTYDSLGRKIRLDDPDLGTWEYGYNFVGNMISQTGGGGNLVTGDNFYREYNGLGQMIRVREGNDANGRILEEYSYDSNGDRIKVYRYSYSGGTNETIYTPYREWMQIRNSSGTFNFYYIYQGGTLVARKNPDGTKYFYHPDHLGSTNLITDENGNVVEEEFFSPFGESLSVNEDEEFKLYTGQFKDSIENQYYYGTRYYNPYLARFMQCDKIKPDAFAPQALNCYAYGLNNPFRYKDDSGNFPVDTLADVGFILYDTYKLITEGAGENNVNLLALGADAGGAVVPYATGLGLAVRSSKVAGKAEDAIKTVDEAAEISKNAEKTADATQAADKTTDIQNAVDDAEDVSQQQFRRNFEKDIPTPFEGAEAHHIIPRNPSIRQIFNERGISNSYINSVQNAAWVTKGHGRTWKIYQDSIRTYIKNNPNAKADEIIKHARDQTKRRYQ